GRLEDLVALPGVGRKTANVVLGNAFGVLGITVDTHVGRLARRLGWTEETDPVKVEHAIGELVERREWTMLSHRLVIHGRRTCFARRPACGACPVARLCPSCGIGETAPDRAAALPTPAPPGWRPRATPAAAARPPRGPPRARSVPRPRRPRSAHRRRRTGRPNGRGAPAARGRARRAAGGSAQEPRRAGPR